MIHGPRELKRRMLLRLKGVESSRALIGPATVELHLTDVCNLACRYCWYHAPDSAWRPAGKNHLPFEVFEKVAGDCRSLKVDSIFLSGQGEPTLHPRFYDMLLALESFFTVTVYSNGTFPVKKCRDILRADHIVINLGAADRDSYRALQGADHFIKVIKNIRELAKLREQFNPGFRIEVAFIASRLNKDRKDATENLVKKLGADVVRTKIAETYGHNRGMRLINDGGIKESVQGWPPCFHGWFYSAINLNGDVCVCSFMRRVTTGNVYKASFKDIWTSKAYARARAGALSGDRFSSFQECIHCPAVQRNQEIKIQFEAYARAITA